MKNKNQLYTFNPWPFILIIGALTMTFGGVLHMNCIESLFFKEFENIIFFLFLSISITISAPDPEKSFSYRCGFNFLVSNRQFFLFILLLFLMYFSQPPAFCDRVDPIHPKPANGMGIFLFVITTIGIILILNGSVGAGILYLSGRFPPGPSEGGSVEITKETLPVPERTWLGKVHGGDSQELIPYTGPLIKRIEPILVGDAVQIPITIINNSNTVL